MKSCPVNRPLGVAGGQGFGHNRCDTRAFAQEDLVAIEVATVDQRGDLLTARGLLCLERHGRKLGAVVSLIDDLMGHDQMVLGIDGDLHIVADGGGPFAAGHHRTGVRIGQRDLLVGRILNGLLHHLQGLHLPAQTGNLLLQSDRLGLCDIAVFAVGPVERPQIMRDAGVDLLHPPGDLGDRVIFVPVIHRFELAAVDRTTA